MSEMSAAKLKDISTKIGSGATPRGGKEAYKSEGISLIRSMNVYDSYFTKKDLAFIDEQQADALSNVEVQENDILLNITGASVARCCMVPKEVLPARVNQHVAIIRIDKKIADPRFIFLSLVSPNYKSKLLSLAQGGATREALTKTTIEEFDVDLPELKDQSDIADAVMTYDNLIENNKRRIAILEQMAQSLYREWFVKFRFPSHDNTKFVDSSLGKMMTNEVSDYGIIKIRNINEAGLDIDNMQYISKDNVADKPLNFKLHEGEVLIAMTGAQVGKVSFVPKTNKPLLLNQRVGRFTPKVNELGFSFLWQVINSEYFKTEIINRAQGAAQPNISGKDIEGISLIKPPKHLIKEFECYLDSGYELIRIIQIKNNILKSQRDLLLPKLLSGNITLGN